MTHGSDPYVTDPYVTDPYVTDPYVTAALRDTTLQTWLASGTRLREDTNAETELAHEGYRATVVWELLQNAYDAARQAPTPRAWVTLHTGEHPYLEVSNTGAALTPAGVASLASLRASTKAVARPTQQATEHFAEQATVHAAQHASGSTDPAHSHPIGRFGVGFAAVRSVSDHIDISSRLPESTPSDPRRSGITFNHESLKAALNAHAATHPHVADILETRAADLPVLRWPEPLEPAALPELQVAATTAVRVWLRDAAAVAGVRNQIKKIDERWLFALPFEELHIAGDSERTFTQADLAEKWFTHARTHELPVPLRDKNPAQFTVLWAAPRTGTLDREQQVLWSPTPTSDALPLPALLVTQAPVNAMREHVLDSPAAQHIAAQAGHDLAAFATALTREGRNDLALTLLPSGFAPNTFAANVFDAARTSLREADLVPTVSGRCVSGREAVLVHSQLPQAPEFAALACEAGFEHLTTLSANSQVTAFFGLETIALADIIEQLPTAHVNWAARFATLAPYATELRAADALGALAVPLADGRVVRGCRGVTLFEVGETGEVAGRLDDDTLHTLQAFGVRLLDPEAYHPLLDSLGLTRLNLLHAVEGEFGRNVCEAITQSFEDGDENEAEELSDMLLQLVRSALPERPAIGFLPLARVHLLNLVVEDVTGELAPLRNVCLPGSPALEFFDADWLTIVADSGLERYGVAALVWCGATRSLPLFDLGELLEAGGAEPVSEAIDDEVVAVEAWLEHDRELVRGRGRSAALVLRDATQVRDEAWPDLLGTAAEVIANHCGGPRDHAIGAGSYLLWWLREEVLQGRSLLARYDHDAAWMRSLEHFEVGVGLAPQWAGRLPQWSHAPLGLGADSTALLENVPVVDVLDALSMPPEEYPGEPEPLAVMALWQRVIAAAQDGTAQDGAAVNGAAVNGAARDGVAEVECPNEVWVVTSGSRCEFVRAGDLLLAASPMWLQRSDLEPMLLVAQDVAAAEVVAHRLQVALADTEQPGLVEFTARDAATLEESRALVRQALTALRGHGCGFDLDLGRTFEVVRCEHLASDESPVGWWVATDSGVTTAYGVTLRDVAFAVAAAAGAWRERYLVLAVLMGEHDVAESARESLLPR